MGYIFPAMPSKESHTMPYGLTVKHDQGGKRLEVRCPHHKELAGLEDPRVKEAMQRWGLYFRERPLDEPESQ